MQSTKEHVTVPPAPRGGAATEQQRPFIKPRVPGPAAPAEATQPSLRAPLSAPDDLPEALLDPAQGAKGYREREENERPAQQQGEVQTKEPQREEEENCSGCRPSIVRETLDELLPGVAQYIPDWATPIIYEVEKRTTPGTRMKVFMNDGGGLVINAYVDCSEKGPKPSTPSEGNVEQSSVYVDVAVEDPSHASKSDPATVEVTSTDLANGEAATVTGAVTQPHKAEHVASKTMTRSMKLLGEPSS
ncbi:hypothetical protein [Streptomyces sp. NPDC014733]|uniref:hypothetical protein n=1 Tax=Streptomyces sp. NPDC014733 TaxID=3364885 RepID=UPI0036FB5DAC